MTKIDYFGEDAELFQGLNSINSIQARMMDINNLSDSSCDAAIIDYRIISITELISLNYLNRKCFYISSEAEKNEINSIDAELFRVKNIIIVPPRRTVDQIIKIIIDDIYNLSDENNIYSFFGCDSKVGTTSLCYNTAFTVAKRHKDKNIMMLILDGQDGSEWIGRFSSIKSLSDIMIMLENNMLTQDSIKASCRASDNLFILKGEGSLKESIFYHESKISNLISFCRKAFDAVFIDAGNIMNLYLRMTYAALIEADNRILITDQSPKSFGMFQKGMEQVLTDLSIDSFKFIILNKYRKNSSLFKREEIITKYKVPVFCTVPYADYSEHAMSDGDSSEFFLSQSYEDVLNSIVSYFEGKLGIEPERKQMEGLAKSFMKKVKLWK